MPGIAKLVGSSDYAILDGPLPDGTPCIKMTRLLSEDSQDIVDVDGWLAARNVADCGVCAATPAWRIMLLCMGGAGHAVVAERSPAGPVE